MVKRISEENSGCNHNNGTTLPNDELKKMMGEKEKQSAMFKPPQICPHCGRCPVCGRRGDYPYYPPHWPWYQVWY